MSAPGQLPDADDLRELAGVTVDQRLLQLQAQAKLLELQLARAQEFADASHEEIRALLVLLKPVLAMILA